MRRSAWLGRAVAVGGCVVSLAIGCSLGSTDGLTSGPEPARDGSADAAPSTIDASGTVSDASPGDASSVGPVDSGDAGGAPNILTNGAFEQGCATGWTGMEPFMTGTVDPLSHSGTSSCRICSGAFDAGTPGGATFTALFGQTVDHTSAPGEQYESEIWVRTAPSTSPPQTFAAAFYIGNDANEDVEHVTTGNQVPTEMWVSIGTTKKIVTGGSTMLLQVTMVRNSGVTTCLLVDDGRLVKK